MPDPTDVRATGGPSPAGTEEPPVAKRHWGKYRGTVVENIDPEGRGRLLVSVPGISITNWAMPCVPMAFPTAGTFMRPGVDANVWVEFERGDPDNPIWVGCYWGDFQTPVLAEELDAVPEIPAMTLETTTSGITLSDTPIMAGGDTPGTVNIIAGAGATAIALTDASVAITAATITITTGTFTIITPTGTFTVA